MCTAVGRGRHRRRGQPLLAAGRSRSVRRGHHQRPGGRPPVPRDGGEVEGRRGGDRCPAPALRPLPAQAAAGARRAATVPGPADRWSARRSGQSRPGDPHVAAAAGDAAGVELVGQGQGVLAGDAERVAELRDREPVRLPRQQPRPRSRRPRRRRSARSRCRRARPPGPAGPARAARPGRRRPAAAGWGRPPRAPAGTGGRRGDRRRRSAGPGRRRRGRRARGARTSRSRSSSVATSSPSGPAAAIRAERTVDHRLDRTGGDHPAADGGRPALAGHRLELVGGDPAPLGDDPVDVARPLRRPHLRRRQDRRHVEHLAAADGLAPAALPQHVAVAGQQRDGLVEVEAHEAAATPGAMAEPPRTRTVTGCSPEPT